MMRSDTTPRGCGPRWPQRQQCHREGVCAVMQHSGDFQALAEQQPHPPQHSSPSWHFLHTRAEPRSSPARTGMSHRHTPTDGISSSSQQMWTPLQSHRFQCLPGVGLFRDLLMPAPEKHHENSSLSTTGSPQQETMAGTATPIACKTITPASSLPITGPDISACSSETGWKGIWLVFTCLWHKAGREGCYESTSETINTPSISVKMETFLPESKPFSYYSIPWELGFGRTWLWGQLP